MPLANTVFQLENDIVKVVVNERLDDRYELILWDTDVDKVVAVRIYPDKDSAIAYAHKCML